METTKTYSKARCEALVCEKQLSLANAQGIDFFHNQISGLVYCVGALDQELGWWNGNIPLDFVVLKGR